MTFFQVKIILFFNKPSLGVIMFVACKQFGSADWRLLYTDWQTRKVYFYVYKVVISVCLIVIMFDHSLSSSLPALHISLPLPFPSPPYLWYKKSKTFLKHRKNNHENNFFEKLVGNCLLCFFPKFYKNLLKLNEI